LLVISVNKEGRREGRRKEEGRESKFVILNISAY
jgi:hypothetical protein